MSTTDRRPGLFLNFEGTDGCGKSTQLGLLAGRLRDAGYRVVQTVEPGGTEIGRQIRRILLDPANRALCPMAELLLYFASRAQNVEELILPALARGEIVLSDRFTDSSMAYQGYARGLGRETVSALDRIACRGVVPDLTLVFDIDIETSLARTRIRNRENHAESESRMDEQAIEFHRRVREAYQDMIAREPERFRVIPGDRPVAEVAQAVWEAVNPLLVPLAARSR